MHNGSLYGIDVIKESSHGKKILGFCLIALSVLACRNPAATMNSKDSASRPRIIVQVPAPSRSGSSASKDYLGDTSVDAVTVSICDAEGKSVGGGPLAYGGTYWSGNF